jgi:HlyD family secretion protein
VVNYTVVVDAQNQDGSLLPGMTATVNFQVNRVTDVLIVPNAALRFQPSAEVLQQMSKNGQQRSGDSAAWRARRTASRQGDSTATQRRSDSSGSGTRSRSARGRVWTLDSAGGLKMIPVHVGLSDGQKTEVSGPGIQAGMLVVTGLAQPQTTTNRGTGLPFGTPGAGGGGRGGGRGF